ncbi:MAG: CinA family protein [Candidatus Dormibacteraeota bacterium]|nr:CinA family protein [Candidatus Dormibacteraeota bacterium]MBV9525872.1 CinA family protein [Candidatus Dormibacteraeota bacterium]
MHRGGGGRDRGQRARLPVAVSPVRHVSEEPAAPLLAEAFPESRAAGEALRAAGLSAAVAESCTGGLLGAALTSVPGSSEYVRGGVIAYDNAVKVAQLGVDPATLETCGAVSAEVAEQMAAGARTRLGAALGVGITGVAGPGAAEGGKPAGLVFVAVAGANGTRVERIDGDRGREENRANAVRVALRLIHDAARSGPGAGG